MENLGVTNVAVCILIMVRKELSLPVDNQRRGKRPVWQSHMKPGEDSGRKVTAPFNQSWPHSSLDRIVI